MNKIQKITIGGMMTTLALILVPTTLAATTNGSFENSNPANIDEYINVVSVNTTSIPGWTVESGDLDLIGTFWASADGSKNIDLNGVNPSSISQTLTTIPSHEYELSFYLAGNTLNEPAVKTLNVKIGDNPVIGFSFDKTGYSLTNMGWVKKTINFIATTASTKITFTSTTPGYYGPALDNVQVEDVTDEVSPTPTSVPTATPTTVPTATPTVVPTSVPTSVPTVLPTTTPTNTPTNTPMPTAVATATPTVSPTPSDPDLPDACVGMTFAHVIKGTNGSNKLMGTNENDLIYAYDGSDTVYGKDGDDCIVGGDGSDNLNGGDGDDVLLGGEGADSLKGGKGADELYGGEGSDDINGNDGDDTSYGDEGYDSCRGGNGTDTCNAEDSKECERNTRHKTHKIGIFHHFFSRH